jgi:WD40 repeat protein
LGEKRSTLRAARGNFGLVAFSPDGRSVAAVSRQGDRVVWDLETAQILKSHSREQRPPQAVTFSPDGRFLATTGPDVEIDLWELEPDRVSRIETGHEATVRHWRRSVAALAFSPDGRILASAGAFDSTVKLWDPVDRRLLTTFEDEPSPAKSLTFLADGRTLVSAVPGRKPRLWDLATRRFVVLDDELAKNHTHFAMAPDGRSWAFAIFDAVMLRERSSTMVARDGRTFDHLGRQPSPRQGIID